MNFVKNKVLYISLGVILIVLLVLLAIFSKKSNDEEKRKDKENNYTLVYEYKKDNFVEQQMEFTYKNKKLDSVKTILFFREEGIADIVAEEYKTEQNDMFKKVTNTKNSITLYYGSSLMSEYKGLNKEELSKYLESQGYKLKK